MTVKSGNLNKDFCKFLSFIYFKRVLPFHCLVTIPKRFPPLKSKNKMMSYLLKVEKGIVQRKANAGHVFDNPELSVS